ncbi:MAG: sialidase family protein [Chitinophagaceae bacterium]
MKVLITRGFIAVVTLICSNRSNAQLVDWRNVKNGNLIATNGYCDQPYAVVLKDGSWLCVYTTGATAEGTGGQHIVSCNSKDQGKTWTKTVAIENPGTESASWAMPYLTKYGRVYVFYDYNGDKIHELNGKKNIREDMLGWYCYKYSDDEGKTWSQRYRLNVPVSKIDLNNDWQGKVQILWGIGKPVDVDGGMMFAFSKMAKYLIDGTEGWFFRCDNINSEKNPGKLKWQLFPGSGEGLKNEKLGPINEEQNIFQLSNGTLYCMERTISGHPAESYSYNGGKTWTVPKVPEYLTGIEMKNPRACPRIWKCKNGKYLFWHHNNGSWNFTSRNPAWISGGIEKNGKIIWSQPEILLYEDEISKRMSYPDLIEQNGKYWITETNKEEAKTNEIPTDFLNMLWSQFDIKTVASKNLVQEWKQEDLVAKSKINIPVRDYKSGFTLDLRLSLGELLSGQIILSSSNNGKSVVLKTGEYGAIEIVLKDGTDSSKWASDPGLIPAYGEYSVSVIVDNGPKIIQFVIDGTVCDGRDFRQYGWGRFNLKMEDFIFNMIEMGTLANGQLQPQGKVTSLRVYNRPLMNTEGIGNHNNFTKQ